MAKTHYWFGNASDNESIVAWLGEHGAVPLERSWESVPKVGPEEIPLYFPTIGPVVFWPDKIDVTVLRGDTHRLKSAVRAQLAQESSPRTRQIDSDHSAVALLCLPYQRQGILWTTGELHFTGANLPQRVPALHRICNQFGRWLQKNELIYKNTGSDLFHPFGNDVAGLDGFVKCVFALPEAYKLIQQKTPMIDRNVSPIEYMRFLRRLQLRGIKVPSPENV